MVMCSQCHKRMAVIFVTKMENGEKSTKGLCLKCAKEMGVPVDNLVGNVMGQFGISPEQLEGAEDDINAMLANTRALLAAAEQSLSTAKEEEEKLKAEKLEKEDVKSQYDYDYDFLAGSISPSEMLDIKDYIEKQKGSEISIEEFKQYFTNPSYMRTLFIKEWNFTDAELQRLLNEVYEENISVMIKFMNNRKETPIVEQVEEAVNPESHEGLNDIPDNFYWDPSMEDESFKNMSFF